MPAEPLSNRIVARFAREFTVPAIAWVPLRCEGALVGCVTPERAARLERFATFTRSAQGLVLHASPDTPEARTSALDHVARTLASEHALTAWRNERYAVAPTLLIRHDEVFTPRT